ncbi:hypothetical protein NDU88_004859 [Pleurodeles waltl]|uniref:Uncharacterized protein n=1 Tax=Pleurodeles waltl TaxID=8319 RepID=A0AAV7MF80_PLEWA|nr:hypothetical protein NDU88_004859 [Pleurodeles waltl]
MFESLRETQRNLLNACMEECAYVIREFDSASGAEVVEKRNTESEWRERCQEEMSEDLGETEQHQEETRAEFESRGAAARNGESGKASHVPGG